MIRAANTGISAIVDPVGRVVAALPLGVDGVLDGQLPQGIPATIFAMFPNWGYLILTLLASFLALIAKRRR